MREREFRPQGQDQLPKLDDGSIIYGEGIYGPSPCDVKFANQVHQELIRERRRARYRIVDFPKNPQEILPWPLVGKLPSPWRDLVIGGTAAVAGLAAAACFGGTPKPKPEQPPDAGDNVPKVVAPIDKPEAEPLNLNGFLDWPHAKHPDMKHVQGWIYSGKEVPDGKEHGANDYVLGTDPNLASTWKKFPVLAAADGLACKESFGQTHAVRVRHPNGYETRNLHMDPDSISQANILTCSADKKAGKPVKRGDKLGLASDTGTERDWNHNHFEVFDPSGQAVDPYDIYGKRDKYPDPNLTNGIPCGPKALWINCRTDAVLGARTEKPTPTLTARPTPTATIDTPRPRGVESENFITEEMRAFAQGLIDEINNRRRIGGLPVLSKNSVLTLSAEDYENFLYKNNNLLTTDLNLNGSPEIRAQARGYSGSIRASAVATSGIEPIGRPRDLFYPMWGETEFLFNVLVSANAKDIGAACVWKKGTIINNQGTRLNAYDLNCLLVVGLERKGFTDPYLAALDWYVRNKGVDPAKVGCDDLKLFCIVGATFKGTNVAAFHGGCSQCDAGFDLWIGQRPDGFWEAVYSAPYVSFWPGPGKAVVADTGDCLNVREKPSLSAKALICLKDNSRVEVQGGEGSTLLFADGYIWVKLRSPQGWSIINYLASCDPERFALVSPCPR